MFKRFAIEDMGSDAFWGKLVQEMMPYEGNQGPVKNIIHQLSGEPYWCESVVFEYDYVDEDYQDEYAIFYSKAFKSYPDRCTRLHFFSCEIPKGTRTNFGQYSKDYLGFMVLRPTDLQRVGRTVLKPGLPNPDTSFINCLAEFRSHILGQSFHLKAMPFIQQDTQVGACAQASLWMLSRYMSKRFGFRRFMPSEINEFAKAKLGMGRHLPAENGLSTYQMLEALESMGFSALYYQRDSIGEFSKHIDDAYPIQFDEQGEVVPNSLRRNQTAKLADVAYRYIESGLPVIFGTGAHAMVGIGHKYEYRENAKVAIQRIPSFYVNNDNSGCYREMPMESPCDEYAFDEVNSLIAVTPRESTLRGESAEDMARMSVEEFLSTIIEPEPKITTKTILGQLRPEFSELLEELEYRTFMIESVVFQRDLREQMRQGRFQRKVGERLLRLDYPKYIWVTEVSSSQLLNKPCRSDRECLGRVLVDSTAPANTRGLIAMHFADMLLLYDRHNKNYEPAFYQIYPDSTPFSHKIW